MVIHQQYCYFVFTNLKFPHTYHVQRSQRQFPAGYNGTHTEILIILKPRFWELLLSFMQKVELLVSPLEVFLKSRNKKKNKDYRKCNDMMIAVNFCLRALQQKHLLQLNIVKIYSAYLLFKPICKKHKSKRSLLTVQVGLSWALRMCFK